MPQDPLPLRRTTLSHPSSAKQMRPRCVVITHNLYKPSIRICSTHRFSSTARTANASVAPPNRPLQGKSLYGTLIAIVLGLPIGFALWKNNRRDDSKGAVGLDPYNFTPYTLIRKEKVGETSSLFTLQAANRLRNTQDGEETTLTRAWNAGVIWSVQIRQPELQIARSYTPLPPLPLNGKVQDEQNLRLWIRKEERGEVSGYLHRLSEGDQVDVRGPNVEFPSLDGVSDCLFIVGGTGVVTAVQGVHALTGSGNDMPRAHVMWACRRREDCVGGVGDVLDTGDPVRSLRWRRWLGLGKSTIAEEYPNHSIESPVAEQGPIVQLFEGLKKQLPREQMQQLTVQYFVDQEKTFIRKTNIEDQMKGLGDGSESRRLILVSGPDGFVSYIAGPKKWHGGREVQGPLGGLLASIDLKGWEVWKL